MKNKESVHRHTEFSKNHDPFNSCLNSECIQMLPADPLRAGPCSGAGDAEVMMQVVNGCF